MPTATQNFPLNPADFGIPTREELVQMRIWDLHYHGLSPSEGFLQRHEATMRYADRLGIERLIALDIGGHPRAPWLPAPTDEDQWNYLVRNTDRVSGIIRIHPNYPQESVAKMERWIGNGPCIGIKYSGGQGLGEDSFRSNHPNNDPIIRKARELNAVVYIHTWIKVGRPNGPRFPGAGNNPGESTPWEVAELAERFPDVPLICGHSGGDWELGARIVRPHENVYFEFSGSDPHSGSVDYAANFLGADRIVWGGHGPSRSYATELGKVLDSDLSKADQMKVLGGNLRRLCTPIFRRKGYAL